MNNYITEVTNSFLKVFYKIGTSVDLSKFSDSEFDEKHFVRSQREALSNDWEEVSGEVQKAFERFKEEYG